MPRTFRCSQSLSALFCLFMVTACAGDEENAPQEPVLAEPDTGNYPDDPALAKDPNAPADAAKTPDDEPVGTLTDNGTAPPEPPTAGVSPDSDGEGEGPLGAFDDGPTHVEGPGANAAATGDESAKSSAAQKKKSKTKKEPGQVTRYVSAVLLNVRTKPSSRAKIVRRLNGGEKVQVTVMGKFAKLGESEWVAAKYLSRKPTKVVTDADVESAWKRAGQTDTWKP